MSNSDLICHGNMKALVLLKCATISPRGSNFRGEQQSLSPRCQAATVQGKAWPILACHPQHPQEIPANRSANLHHAKRPCFMKIFKHHIIAAVAMTVWMAVALQGWSQGNTASPTGAVGAPSGNGQANLIHPGQREANAVQLQGNGHDAPAATHAGLNDGTLEIPNEGAGFLKSAGKLSISASDVLKVNSVTRDNILENLVKYNVTRSTFTMEQLHAQPQSVQHLMLTHPAIFVVQ